MCQRQQSTLYFYRPQGKVMRLEACVCHSVRGGVYPGDPPARPMDRENSRYAMCQWQQSIISLMDL